MNMTTEASSVDLHNLSLKIRNCFLSSTNESSKWNLLREFYNNLPKIHNNLAEYYFTAEVLLDSLQPNLFIEQWQEILFDSIFLEGVHHEAFMILVRKYGESCESYKQKKILNILQKFLKGPSLENLFLSQCISYGADDPQYLLMSPIWNDLITFLISMPERVANKTKGQMPKIFRNDFYVPYLISTIFKMLSVLHEKIINCQNCTLEFIGNLIGRLSIAGNAGIIAKKFSIEFIKRSETDFVWRKLSQNLVSKMPISSLESFVTNLLLVIPWYGYVDWILGEETVKNEKLKYLMTVKLILFRSFKEEKILQNIIGHYASSEYNREYFWKILESLIRIWADASALRYQSHEQQKYISIALMICCGWFKNINDTTKGTAFMSNVLKGVEIRIGSSIISVRNFGLIVGSALMSVITPNNEILDFKETADNKMLDYLNSFMNILQKPEKDSIYFKEDFKCYEDVELQKNKWNHQQLHDKIDNAKSLDSNVETESDDDLDPYDMDDDVPQEKLKYPLYLNDCLQGLTEQNNSEWFEQCLKHAENLITANLDTLDTFAEEMTKVMLHLQDTGGIEKFDILRKQILVSLCKNSPLIVANYLTTQFYERDYNIRQRLDILEVISTCSLLLSQPNSVSSTNPASYSQINVPPNEEWKTIVEKRIAAKTRIITKGPKKPLMEPTDNKFAPVAGYFFYPLMEKYDKNNQMLQLFGEDSYVLGRLIYTLGTVMYAASNTPLCFQMGESLMEFLLNVRNHQDVMVRLASIFALVTVYGSVPGYLLFSEEHILSALYESQQWLKSVIDNDSNTDCQLNATYALSFILNIMKEEVPLLSGILKN